MNRLSNPRAAPGFAKDVILQPRIPGASERSAGGSPRKFRGKGRSRTKEQESRLARMAGRQAAVPTRLVHGITEYIEGRHRGRPQKSRSVRSM